MADIFTLGIKADSSGIRKGKKDLDELADSAEGAEESTVNLREGFNDAAKAAVAFGIAGVTAMVGITVAAADSAKEILNLARVSNLTVEEFQRAAFAARTYGIEQDKLADILKDTQDKIGDFLTTGAGPLADFFETIAPKVDITANMFRGLSGKEGLQLYFDGLKKANLSQSEMVFFMEAIASDATLLQPLLENNGKAFKEMGEQADELGIVLDELDIQTLKDFSKELNIAKATSEGLANTIGATLAPFVTALTKQFNDNAFAAEDVRDITLDAARAIVTVTGVFADAGRAFEITGIGIGVSIFTIEQKLITFEERFKLTLLDFATFSDKFNKKATTWLNELLVTTTKGMQDFANAVVDPLGRVEDTILEPFQLPAPDTDALLAGIAVARAKLEKELAGSNASIADAQQDLIDLLAKPLPSAGFDDWFKAIEKTVAAQRELQKEVKKTGTTAITTIGKTTRAESKAANERRDTQLSSLKEITAFATGAVDEQSRARKQLHALEQSLTVIEVGLSLQKAGANAIEAITSAFSAPFPVNFAAGAAMIGIMASLGVFSGGGGTAVPTSEELQTSQGTGTTFGDAAAKSESILRSQERFEDISLDQLAELRGIRTSLTALADGITQITRTVLSGGLGTFGGTLGGSNFGDTALGRIMDPGSLDPTGLTSSIQASFSSTTREVIDSGISFVAQTLGEIINTGVSNAQTFFTVETTKDSFFGLIESSDVDQEFQNLGAKTSAQIGGVLANIGETVLEAAEFLGFSTKTFTDTVIEGVIFSTEDLLDGTRQVISDFITSTQITTVGLREALESFVVDIGMISFEGLSGAEIEEQLQAIFSTQADLITEFLVPSLLQFQQVGEGAFETLLRVTKEQAQFNDAIAELGINLSDLTNLMQIDIAQAVIDLSGGIEQFRESTNLFFQEFFTEEEQFTRLTTSLTEAVGTLGVAMFETREGFRSAIEAVDLTTDAGQRLFAGLLELAPAFDQFFDVLEERAEDAAQVAEEVVTDVVEAAEEIFTSLTPELTRAAQTALRVLQQQVTAAQREISSMLRDELRSIGDAFDLQREAVVSKTSAQVDSLVNMISTAANRVSELTTLSTSLSDAISETITLTRNAARLRIQQAVETGNVLGAGIQEAARVLSSVDQRTFGSALEFQLERARASQQLKALKDVTDSQLTEAEQSIMLLEEQILTIERSGENQIAALEVAEQAAREQAQVNADAQISELQTLVDTAAQQLNATLGLKQAADNLGDSVSDFLVSINALTNSLVRDVLHDPTADTTLQSNLTDLAATTKKGILTPNKNIQASTGGGDFTQEDMLMAVVASTAKTAKLLDRWDGDGQPEIRNVS